MEPVIQLDGRQRLDLIEVLSLPEGTVRRVAAEIGVSKAAPFLSSGKFQEFLSILCPGHPRSIEALVRILLSIATLRSQLTLKPSSIEVSLLNAVAADKRITQDQVKQLSDLLPEIIAVTQEENFIVLTKVLRLSYDFTNLLLSSKLLTDARPIFDEEATHVAASVVTFSLQLDFTSAQNPQTMNFALDWSDVEHLRDQCTRALVKAGLVSDLLRDQAGIPTRIAGQNDL